MNQLNKVSNSLDKLQTDLGQLFTSLGYHIGIIILFIGIIFFIYELYIFYKINEISKWPVILNGAEIISTAEENLSNYSTLSILFYSKVFYENYYRTNIAFNYEKDGVKYTSIHYSYYEPWYTNKIRANMDGSIYKVGSKQDLIMNPKNPNEAYIINKPYDSYENLLFGLFLLSLGIIIIYKNTN